MAESGDYAGQGRGRSMIWEGGRDRDQAEPGIVSDMACLAFAMLNAVLWPLLAYLLVAR